MKKEGKLLISVMFVLAILIGSTLSSGVNIGLYETRVSGILMYNPLTDNHVGTIIGNDGVIYKVTISSNRLMAVRGTFILHRGADWQGTELWHIGYEKITPPQKFTNVNQNKKPVNQNVVMDINAISTTISINRTYYTIGISTNWSTPVLFISQNSYPLFFNNVSITGLYLSAKNLSMFFGLNLTHMERNLLQILVNITMSNLSNYVVLANTISPITSKSIAGQLLKTITPTDGVKILNTVFLEDEYPNIVNYTIWMLNHTKEQIFIISNIKNSVTHMELELIFAPIYINSTQLDGIVHVTFHPSYMGYLSNITGVSYKYKDLSIIVGSVLNKNAFVSSGYINVNVNDLWGMNTTGVSVKGFVVKLNFEPLEKAFGNIITIPASIIRAVHNYTKYLNVHIYVLINKDLTFALNSKVVEGFTIVIMQNVNNVQLYQFDPIKIQGVVYNTQHIFDINTSIPILFSSHVLQNTSFGEKHSVKVVSGILLSDLSITSNFTTPFTNMAMILLKKANKNIFVMFVHDNLGKYYFVNATISLTRDVYGWWAIQSIRASPLINFNIRLYQSNNSYYDFKNVQIAINSTAISFLQHTYGINDNMTAPFFWIANKPYPMIDTKIIMQGTFLPKLNLNIMKILNVFNFNLSSTLNTIVNAFNITISGLGNNIFVANNVIYAQHEWKAIDLLAKITPYTLTKYFNEKLAKRIDTYLGNHILSVIEHLVNDFNEKFLLGIPSDFSLFNQQYYLLVSDGYTKVSTGLATMNIYISNINYSFSINNVQFSFTLASVGNIRITKFAQLSVPALWNTTYKAVAVDGFGIGVTSTAFLNWALPFLNISQSLITSIQNYVKALNVGVFILFNNNLQFSLNNGIYHGGTVVIIPNFQGTSTVLEPMEIKGILFQSSTFLGISSNLNFPIILSNKVILNPVFSKQHLVVSGIVLSDPELSSTLPEPFTNMSFIIENPWNTHPHVMLVHSNLNHYAVNGTIYLSRDNFGWWRVLSITPSPFLNLNISILNKNPYYYFAKNVIVNMNTTSISVFGYTFGINQNFRPPYIWVSDGNYPMFDTHVVLSGVFLSSININPTNVLDLFHLNLPTLVTDLMSLLNVTVSGLQNDILMVNSITGINTINANMQIVGSCTPTDLYNLISQYTGSALADMLSNNVISYIYKFINATNQELLLGYDVNNNIDSMNFYILFAPTSINAKELCGVVNAKIVKSNLRLTLNLGTQFNLIIGSVFADNIRASGYSPVSIQDLWTINGVGVSVSGWAVGIDALEVSGILNSELQQYFNLDITDIVKMTQVLNPAIFVVMDHSLFFNSTEPVTHSFALVLVPNYHGKISNLGFFTFNGIVYNAGQFFHTNFSLPVVLVSWIGTVRATYPFLLLPTLATKSNLALDTPIATTGIITGTTLKLAGNVLSTWIAGLSVVNYSPLDIGIYDLAWSSNNMSFNVPVIYPVLGYGPSYLTKHVDVYGYYVNYSEAILWLKTVLGLDNNTTYNLGKYLTYLLNSELSKYGLETVIFNGFIIATSIVVNSTINSITLYGYSPTLYINRSTYQYGYINASINAYLTINAGISLKYQYPAVYCTIITPDGEKYSGKLNSNYILVPFFADNMSNVVVLPAEIGAYQVILSAYAYDGYGEFLASYTYEFTVSLTSKA